MTADANVPERDPYTRFVVGGKSFCSCWRLLFRLSYEELPDHVCTHVAEVTCRKWVKRVTDRTSPLPEGVCLPDGTPVWIGNPARPAILRRDPLLGDTVTQIALVIQEWIEDPVAEGNYAKILQTDPAWCEAVARIKRHAFRLFTTPLLRYPVNTQPYVRTAMLRTFIMRHLYRIGVIPTPSVVDWTLVQIFGRVPDGTLLDATTRPCRGVPITLFLELWPAYYTQADKFLHQSGFLLMSINYYGQPRVLKEAQSIYRRYSEWVTDTLNITLLTSPDLREVNTGGPRKQDAIEQLLSKCEAGRLDKAGFEAAVKQNFQEQYQRKHNHSPSREKCNQAVYNARKRWRRRFATK